MAAGVGYAIGQGRQGTAKIAEAKAKYTEQFNTYKLGMEQPLTPEEQKIFREFKRQTPNEVKKEDQAK